MKCCKFFFFKNQIYLDDILQLVEYKIKSSKWNKNQSEINFFTIFLQTVKVANF